MATTYGKTWWGAQWLGALKDIDYSNRLPRGASYARNGMVKQIEFEGNVIKAKVQGSRITPYSETIKLPQFTKDDIDKFINLIVARPIVLSKLFNRQLDESLAKMAEKVGIPLFPKKWSDLKMQCSCPDWAVPCKHLAAVIYKTSMEIDNNPFLVFSLHGVDLLKELESRGLAPAVAEMMEVVNMETIINDSQVLNTEPVTGVVDYTLLHDLTLPLSNLLPPSPAFCHDRDFLAVYQKGLQRMVKMADRVLKDKQPLVEAGEDKVPAKHDACGVADLTPSFCQQLLNINVDMLPDYHPTIIAARNLVVCALQLLAHGCIVPQIFYRNVPKKGPGHPKKKAVARGYVILWQPAMIDEETRRILAHFGQQQGLLCKIITDLVHNFNISVSGDVFHDMFFCGVSYPFVQIGETNIPGGIRSWLDRYFMQTKYRVTFKIEETDNGFAMDVLVDDTPLQHIMEQEAWAEHRMEILRQLAILGDIVTPLADLLLPADLHRVTVRDILFALDEGDARKDPLRALHEIETRIGTRRVDGVLDHERMPLDRPDHRRRLVAALRMDIRLPALRTVLRRREEVVALRIALDAVEIIEPVAAVDVHHLHHGDESVRRIGIPLMPLIPPQAPVVLIAAVGHVEIIERPEIVNVRAFGVLDLAEKPLPDQVERQHLRLAVAAVLELHAMATGALARLHERPALLERQRCGHFDRHVLAMLHRVERDRRMQLPGTGDVDEIDIRLAQRLVRLLADILLRRGLSVLLQPLLLRVDTILVQVAERRDLGSRNRAHAMHRRGTAHAETYETDAHSIKRLGGKLQHTRLTLRTMRLIEHNGVADNPIVFLFSSSETAHYYCR